MHIGRFAIQTLHTKKWLAGIGATEKRQMGNHIRFSFHFLPSPPPNYACLAVYSNCLCCCALAFHKTQLKTSYKVHVAAQKKKVMAEPFMPFLFTG